MALTREDILAAIAKRSKEVTPVEVPEWGGSVFIRRLSAADAERSGMTADDKSPEMISKVLAASLTDETGTVLFSATDMKALTEADLAVSARVFAECVKVNGLSSTELDEAVAAFTSAQPESSSTS